MRKNQLFFYLALIMSVITTQGQDNNCPNNLLTNGDFSTATCGGDSAFQSNCVTNWVRSSGSPSLHGYPTNAYAWLWSHAGGGESIAGSINFTANTTYTISFRIKTDGVNADCTENIATNSQVFIVATNNAGAVTASPTGDIILNQPASASLNNWTSITTTFTPTANYSQLWVYPFKQVSDGCQVNLTIDDICITLAPNNQGAYCCEGENLVDNGNFESTNTSFSSHYTNDASLFPGAYNIDNNATLFGATINDHSFCSDSTQYANNSQFLLVNGKTTQFAGTFATVWEQTINTDPEKNYKLCANFKNMPQCTFDILPEIQFEINGQLYGWEKINTDPTNPCDWLQITECFTGESDVTTIKILLKEDGLGDGNDLAIDDISVQQKLDQNLSLTIQNQGNPQQITGSINTIDIVDDALLTEGSCFNNDDDNKYYWFVYELASFPFNAPIDFVNMAPNSFSWSSNIGGFSSQLPTSANPTWDLTTTFPNYTFENNKLYVIGMYVPSCCDSCYDEAWSYQLTLNGFKNSDSNLDTVFTTEVKEHIKALFKSFDGAENINTIENSLSIYPNPVGSILNINTQETIESYEIYDLLGKKIQSNTISENKIDVSNLNASLYILHVKTTTNKSHSIKFIKQ